ncbi:hypothetical protein QP511_11860, partial [Rothia aeria]|nr:hypothetical protein [Rothia aeria]
MSFDPHPRLVLQPDFDLELISTLSEKKKILAQNDLHNFVIQSFTREFSQVSARDFVVDYLIGKINVHTLVIGYDH